MRADNSRHIISAARNRAERTRERAITALRRMEASGQPVSFDAVARSASVSRSWLYAQDDLKAEISRLRAARTPARPRITVPARQRATEASLLRRLEAAASRISHLEQENQRLRDGLAHSLGQERAAAIYGPPCSDTPKHTGSKPITTATPSATLRSVKDTDHDT